MESFRNPLPQQLDHCRDDLLGLIQLNKMEVGTRLCSAYVRHLAPANAVRVGDNSAALRLAEDFSQAHNWYDAAFYQVVEHCSRPNGGKLVYIDDHKTTSQRIGFVTFKPTGSGIDFQQAVNRLRFQTCCLGEPLCRPPCW